jgi:hypothetical protein
MPSPATCRLAELPEQIAAQRAAIARFEAALWDGGFNENLLASYQAAWRRLENLLEASGAERHGFVIVLPVADSPVHLQDCLASLLELCRAYGYGGMKEGRWHQVEVLLADDSGDLEVIARNRAIAREFDAAGLTTHYFGLEAQLALLDRLAAFDLAPILGNHARDAFHHKGQAMMRNLAYLQCAAMRAGAVEPWLLYTIDADQEFRVNVATPEGPRNVLAVNFLYHLDELFSHSDLQVLTGKVVGDPPVSPAVMAGNFLEDVLGFLDELAVAVPDAPYRQPGGVVGGAVGGDAAYHDMADLFGFAAGAETYRYRCPLPGTPDNAACFVEFSRRLNSFFHGEHPTRVTWYQHADVRESVAPARTVYTGNYVFRPEALDWFIPFAPLRLRMSGPTMGRMLKAGLGANFVSANLPMLHKRTLEDTGQSEFRPGVLDEAQAIDLCGEFERQFHGDVMLFSMEQLTARGYPDTDLDATEVESTLAAMQVEMREKYRVKQGVILERLDRLNALLNDPRQWWRESEGQGGFASFAANLERNFGADSPCQARLDSAEKLRDWRTRQTAAITSLRASRVVWRQALKTLASA